MHLSKAILPEINSPLVEVPAASLLQLPEKVLQFGTGVLLRGLPDYYIDKANKAGLFNGRVVVVKSTTGGETTTFDEQDSLYTQCLKGVEGQAITEKYTINASISRVLSAHTHWQAVLDCAANPDMEVIISNTTETGIVHLSGDYINNRPPVSFPGKLLAFLHRRYLHFNGNAGKGMVILPTELLGNNGDILRQIVVDLARENELDETFLQWLETANHFCNTLVDRIVPGKLSAGAQAAAESALGYKDDLMIMSETYGLWVIETHNEEAIQRLSFAAADPGCVVTDDIHIFRELKIRLLNGTHTFSCGLALLSGIDTVKEAMDNPQISGYMEALMRNEIIPCIRGKVPGAMAADFAVAVLDRFRNPYIEHQWLNITLNYTQKMQMRNLPLLITHYRQSSTVPRYMAQGFAAYILFMQCKLSADKKYYSQHEGKNYWVQDEQAAFFAGCWSMHQSVKQVVEQVLGNTTLWGADLTLLAGFAVAVTGYIEAFMRNGVAATLSHQQLVV